MPGGFPLGQEICNGKDVGTDTANSIGTALVGGVSNAKGSYTQLTASSPVDACWILVTLKETQNTTTSCAVDIAVGAAASEKVIISNLLVQGTTNGNNGNQTMFPCSIPAGTRISARGQNNSASADGPAINVILFDGAFTQLEAVAGIVDWGFVSASTACTILTAGATPNVKTAYTQLVASTTVDCIGFIVHICANASGSVAARVLLDVAIGTAGSEIIILPNMPISSLLPGYIGPFWIPIPAATSVSVRMQSDTATTTTAVMLHGIYQ